MAQIKWENNGEGKYSSKFYNFSEGQGKHVPMFTVEKFVVKCASVVFVQNVIKCERTTSVRWQLKKYDKVTDSYVCLQPSKSLKEAKEVAQGIADIIPAIPTDEERAMQDW